MSLLGPPSLVKTGFIDGFKNAQNFKGLMTIGPDGSSTIDRNPPEIVIERLENLHKRNPKDWLVLYNLGSWYLRDKQYCNSVRALEKAYQLRPNDPRSSFSLATSYRTLARAKDINIDIDTIIPSGLPPQIIEEMKKNYDPINQITN